MSAAIELQSPVRDQLAKPFTSSSQESAFVWIITLWLFAIAYFDPRILALVTAAPNLISQIAVVIVVLCLNLFWFYTLYYVGMTVSSWWLRRGESKTSLPALKDHPPVAVLYPTRNDFREDAVETLLQMDYPHFHLFILDDSTMDEFSRRIDRWAAGHASQVTVIRREVHQGFKAGNVNYTLRQIHQDYSYFAICDDDGIFPRNFISDLLPHLESDASVAFAQARQEGNPAQPGFFGQAMGYAVAMHFRHYVRARQAFGFLMFYGHGALLRTSTWKQVGGFPEIVTEDLAYSARIRALGCRGVFVDDVVCYEDYPPTYAQLRKRTEKWIRGTAEFLKLEFGSFWKSTCVPWFEKVDVLVHATTHFMAVPMLLFLILLGTLLPMTMHQFQYPGSYFLMPVPEGKSVIGYLTQIRYHIFWSWDFYFVMMLTILAPMLPILIDHRKNLRKVVNYISTSTFVYFGSMVAEAASLFAFLLTGKAFFRNTHDVASEKKMGLKEFLQKYHPNHPLVWVIELSLGLLFLGISWQTRNLWFLAPGSALLLSPLVHVLGWRTQLVRALTAVPFLVGVVILGFVTLHLARLTLLKLFE